ncbi:MAG: caspase family protein [Bacteroidota bacterium]
MKKIIILIACFFPVLMYGQSFSGKTNQVYVNYTVPITATSVPSITWTTPLLDRSNSIEKAITIEALVESIIPLKELKLEITNGGETRIKSYPVTDTDTRKVIRQSVTLGEGENLISIIVTNAKGGKSGSTRSVLTGTDAITEALDVNRKDYALLITTDNYDHWTDLSNPIGDGRTISDILKQKYNFDVEILENPTLEEINDKLFDYNTKKFNPQDQLFIFIAGHGYFDETLGEGYLVASNSLMNDKGKSSYIPHLLIRERINNIKCEHIFLMMDVCFGGTIDPVLAKNRGGDAMDESMDQQYLIQKLTKRTRKFLTSGSKEYVPDGAPGRHSPFAEKFILALKEIGGGSGRILSLVELRTYFLRLSTEPRFGSFGNDDPASDFVFVARQ